MCRYEEIDLTLETWLLFCMTEAVLCAIPGPGVLLIVSFSLTRGSAAGIAATMGILIATIFYFIFAATGLGAILQVSGDIFILIKYLGAAYLIWLGVSLIRLAFKPDGSSAGDTETASHRKAFWQGFITHASNPKLLVFFTAILPQFIDPAENFSPQVVILGFSALIIQTMVLLAYAVLSAKAGKMAGLRLIRIVRGAGGALLIGAGAGLASITRGV
jgi:homoserine/homoserine lactone efflux protein